MKNLTTEDTENTEEGGANLEITQESWVKAKVERLKALRERDEALEISKAASKGISKTALLNQFLLSELIAVRKERDELKEIASEFAMTASHCLGWHENKNPNQITSALSRWFKISTNELDA